MREVIKKYNVYKFNELSGEVKEKVLEKYYDINVDYEWWLYDDIYNEIANDYGLKIRMEEICFDLDRSNYIYFETFNHSYKNQDSYIKGIYVDDYNKFCQKAGLGFITKDNEKLGFVIEHKHLGGGDGYNYINSDNLTTIEEEKLQETLDNFTNEIKSQLRANYDYSTSEESIIETIQANDYDFTEDGDID